MKRMARAPWEDDPRLDHTPASLAKVVLGSVLCVALIWGFLILLLSAGPM